MPAVHIQGEVQQIVGIMGLESRKQGSSGGKFCRGKEWSLRPWQWMTLLRERRGGERRGQEKEREQRERILRMPFSFFSAKEEPFRKLEKNYSLLQEETYYYHSVQE